MLYPSSSQRRVAHSVLPARVAGLFMAACTMAGGPRKNLALDPASSRTGTQRLQHTTEESIHAWSACSFAFSWPLHSPRAADVAPALPACQRIWATNCASSAQSTREAGPRSARDPVCQTCRRGGYCVSGVETKTVRATLPHFWRESGVIKARLRICNQGKNVIDSR